MNHAGIPNPSPFITVMQAADGKLYGIPTNKGGDSDWGAIFVLDTSGSFEVLHSFTDIEGVRIVCTADSRRGWQPVGVEDRRGEVRQGVEGAAFRVTLDGQFSVLHAFDPVDGRNPYGALVQAADGNFYGTTARGGTNGTDRLQNGPDGYRHSATHLQRRGRGKPGRGSHPGGKRQVHGLDHWTRIWPSHRTNPIRDRHERRIPEDLQF